MPPARRKNKRPQNRINESIRAKEVRLVGADGGQLGEVSLKEALVKADEAGLDLVEIAPKAKPPVCRIMDYSKYRYEQQRKEKAAKKNSHQIKVRELRLGASIAEHDLQVKEKTIARLLSKGDRVRVAVRLRGRENDHPQIGLDLLERVKEALADQVEVIQEPRHQGREITMVVGPNGQHSDKSSDE